MKRLSSALQLDLRLQKRYGLYYAGAFVTLVWIVILRQLPAWTLDIAVPFVIFTDLGVIGFYFIAGMLLFEKGEQTLLAIVVSPLRFGEYLTSKLVTLTLLAAVASLVVVVVTYGVGFNLILLMLGVALMSLLALLIGFISVSPFTSISDYIIPSVFYVMVMYLPLIDYFGWWQSWVFYLIPFQGALLLLKGAFWPVETWQIVYAVLYQLLWAVILVRLARWAFDRYIVGNQANYTQSVTGGR